MSETDYGFNFYLDDGIVEVGVSLDNRHIWPNDPDDEGRTTWYGPIEKCPYKEEAVQYLYECWMVVRDGGYFGAMARHHEAA